MDWLTPEFVQALGVATAGIIGAATAWQSRRIKQLTERVATLEAQMVEERGKFRSAVRVIRSLLRFIDDLSDTMRRAGQDAPPNPVVIPPELAEEI
ncbi:hypothetical protein [Nocardia sp. SC052]|uniref:hypothetical protein n=1 Tax=Nocardia sichangensis TaxID=3385975 RepID=UPI0039A363B0